MSNVVWRSPVPSSGYLRGVSVQERPKREVVLTFEFEHRDGKMRKGELHFRDVVHYRTTYLWALRADVIRDAYDQVVDMGNSGELGEVTSVMRANRRDAQVRHFRACFDDGPAFDFIASSFEAHVFELGADNRESS
jgi:hypothetical protein